MTIEQTIVIPASHRLIIDVPPEIPAGPAILAFRPATYQKSVVEKDEKTVKPLNSLVGIHKGLDTLEAYFERKRADKEKEDVQIEKQLRKSKGLE